MVTFLFKRLHAQFISYMSLMILYHCCYSLSGMLDSVTILSGRGLLFLLNIAGCVSWRDVEGFFQDGSPTLRSTAMDAVLVMT
jgi:hypothetical protein